MNADKAKKPPSQGQKFKDAAKAADADTDEARWEERLRKVALTKSPKE